MRPPKGNGGGLKEKHLVMPRVGIGINRNPLLLGSLSQWPENFSKRRVALMLENG